MVAPSFTITSLVPLSAVDVDHAFHQPFLLSVGVVSFALLLWMFTPNRGANSRDLRFPPGPKPLPLIGNLHQVNTAEPWLTYTAWKGIYGEFDLFKVYSHAQSLQVICYTCASLVRPSSS